MPEGKWCGRVGGWGGGQEVGGQALGGTGNVGGGRSTGEGGNWQG